MLLILDASVIVKWFKEEDGTAEALRIRAGFTEGRHDVIVPDLVLYEITNVLRYDQGFSAEIAADAMRSFFEMRMSVIAPSPRLADSAFRVARDLGITAYDAMYAALAKAVGGVLVTADKRLARALGPTECRLLEEFEN